MARPRTPSSVALVAALVLAAACAQVEFSTPERDGPPFAEAFPDPSVLVTTDDVAGTRALLATVQLPTEPAALEELVRLAEAAPALDTAHLLLLTEAVPAPWDYAVDRDEEGTTWRIRWTAEVDAGDDARYAELSDRILRAGMARWSDPGRRGLGLLLARARQDETLVELSDRYLAAQDDGSVAALEEILDGMRTSFRTDTFVLQVLVPRDLLQGERQWAAIDALSFDSERTEVMTALIARRDELDVPYLLRCLQRLSFDSARMAVVEAVEGRLGPCDADALRSLMETFSFDSDRGRLLRALSDRVVFDDVPDVCRTLRLFSFGSDRRVGLETLVEGSALRVAPADLVELVGLGDFDSTRREILALVEPRLDGALTADDLHEVLRRFGFDDDRLEVLRLLSRHAQALSPAEVERIAGLFGFDSTRAQARRLLTG